MMVVSKFQGILVQVAGAERVESETGRQRKYETVSAVQDPGKIEETRT